MKRQIGKVVLALSVFAMLSLFVVSIYREGSLVLGIDTIEAAEAEMMFAEREMLAPYEAWKYLQFDKKEIPYDIEENRLFITQKLSNGWNGRLTTEQGELFYLNDPLLYDKEAALSQAHDFILVWMNDMAYTCFYCTFSGLPIVVLEEENPQKEHDRDDSKGVIKVYEMTETGLAVVREESDCLFHKRGASNMRAPKENLRVSLKKENGDLNKRSLLGMRRDDDWVLHSLWDDSMGIHNKLGFEIWNMMSKDLPKGTSSPIKMEYVEFIINGSYQGLYALVEYPDKKEFGLGEGDVLYRTRRHEEELDDDIVEEMQIAEQESRVYLDGLELQYPKEKINESQSWQPMIHWWSYLHAGEPMGGEPEFRINIENCIDYAIFVQMTAAEDNVFKNSCVSAKKIGDVYEIRKNPWDLNLTWGCCWSDIPNAQNRNVVFLEKEAYETERYFCSDAKQLLADNPREISSRMYERWKQLRISSCSDESMLMMLDYELGILRRSGAMVREQNLWNTWSYGSTETELESFIINRLHYLDDYYAELYRQYN